MNALADRSPGFVWRLRTDGGDATTVRAFDDETLIVNMSVWSSFEALADFTYRSHHRDVTRRRREWFERMDEAYLVLWWIPAGHVPDIEEAERKLAQLRADGPTAAAFTFGAPFPPPSERTTAAPELEGCPAP